MITAQELLSLAPNLSSRAASWANYANAALTRFEINTYDRETHFFAQALHESGSFRWMHELWGPTPAQRSYEGRASLGNTKQGDGFRYRGRGIFQLTGRSNYRTVGQALGIPLEGNPELAAQPEAAFMIAAYYWKSRNINRWADMGRSGIEEVTKAINGGYNGLADRRHQFDRARAILSKDDPSATSQTRVKVKVNNVIIEEAQGILIDDRIEANLRPVCEAAGYYLEAPRDDTARVFQGGIYTNVPIRLVNGVSRAFLSTIPCRAIDWDSPSKTANFLSIYPD